LKTEVGLIGQQFPEQTTVQLNKALSKQQQITLI